MHGALDRSIDRSIDRGWAWGPVCGSRQDGALAHAGVSQLVAGRGFRIARPVGSFSDDGRRGPRALFWESALRVRGMGTEGALEGRWRRLDRPRHWIGVESRWLSRPRAWLGGCVWGAIDRRRKGREGRSVAGRQSHTPVHTTEIDPAQAVLAPNIMARGFVSDYKEGKTRDWEAAEQQ